LATLRKVNRGECYNPRMLALIDLFRAKNRMARTNRIVLSVILGALFVLPMCAVAVCAQGSSERARGLERDEIAKVLARDPNNALAYYERAQVYSDRNENDAALRDAEKSVEQKPNPAGRILLASILLRPPEHGAAADDASKRCALTVDALEPVMPQCRDDSETLFLLSRLPVCRS
jgi:tetratricopeptide (TPR) repeat protein